MMCGVVVLKGRPIGWYRPPGKRDHLLQHVGSRSPLLVLKWSSGHWEGQQQKSLGEWTKFSCKEMVIIFLSRLTA